LNHYFEEFLMSDISDISILKIKLFPLSDLHCGYGLQQGNILPSLNYIPGRVLRGALAGWCVRNGIIKDNQSPDFKKLFQTSDFSISGVSFPFCYLEGRAPVPASVFRVGKAEACHPLENLLPGKEQDFISADTGCVENGCPVDFLRRKNWPCEVHPQLVPVRASVGNMSTNTKIHPNAPTVLDMRNRHEPNTGRVGEDGLFAEEMISYAHPWDLKEGYTGLFVCKNEVKDIFLPLTESCDTCDKTNPDPIHTIFMGRRRAPVCILADETTFQMEEIINDIDSKDSLVDISFSSDYLPSQSGIYPIKESFFNKDIGLPDLKIERRFCVRGLQHGFAVEKDEQGFDSEKNRSTISGITAQPCFSAGTSVLADPGRDLTEELIKDLVFRSVTGIGKETANGCGRFAIDSIIHEIAGD
jgi:hypothetical protein